MATNTDANAGWETVPTHEFPERILSWDETDTVEGKLLWRETVPTTGRDGQPRDASMYAIVTTDGEEVGVWGSAHLDPQMARVSDGELVRIRHLGKDTIGGGRSMHRFEVLHRSAP